jgi:hypothetical protein
VTRGRAGFAAALLGSALLAGCASLPTRTDLLAGPAPHEAMRDEEGVVDGRARFREIFCGVLRAQSADTMPSPDCAEWLWRLDGETPAAPRPLPPADLRPQVYLVTGAFSDCLGDEAKPFHGAVPALEASGYRIATIVVSGRSGSAHNAGQIAERLASAPPGEEGPVVLIGYSKGATDILEFLVRYPDLAARVDSVVSIAGAIGGSPLADEVDAFYDLLLSRIPEADCPPGDGGVVDSLRVETRRDWLAQHALPGTVRYFSIAAFTTRPRVAAALVPTWEQLLRHDRYNDGQLLARDALIPGSTLLAYLDADHWAATLDVESAHHRLAARQDPVPFPRAALLEAVLLQVAEERSAGHTG